MARILDSQKMQEGGEDIEEFSDYFACAWQYVHQVKFVELGEQDLLV